MKNRDQIAAQLQTDRLGPDSATRLDTVKLRASALLASVTVRCNMTALGQSRRFCDVRAISGLPPLATAQRTSRGVPTVPNADCANLWHASEVAQAETQAVRSIGRGA
jgi:hypothetical protein